MKIIEVKLNTIQDVQNIVHISMKYSAEIDLMQERYRVSGTSLLGIFALDLTKPVKMIIDCNDDLVVKSIVKELDKLIVNGCEIAG